MRAKTQKRRANSIGEFFRQSAMIKVGVGDENMGDPFTFERFQQSFKMFVIIRARINDGDIAFANDIGAGACVGIRARIIRNNATHARREHICNTGREMNILDEGDGGQWVRLLLQLVINCRGKGIGKRAHGREFVLAAHGGRRAHIGFVGVNDIDAAVISVPQYV